MGEPLSLQSVQRLRVGQQLVLSPDKGRGRLLHPQARGPETSPAGFCGCSLEVVEGAPALQALHSTVGWRPPTCPLLRGRVGDRYWMKRTGTLTKLLGQAHWPERALAWLF